MSQLTLNDQPRALDADPKMPLLWALRESLGLKGTKYGCGAGVCGICAVLIDSRANRACMVPLAKVAGRQALTIEGLVARRHPLIAAWLVEQVSLRGYYQRGQVTAALPGVPAQAGLFD